MRIAGFQKQSLIDFPGNISSVIFTQGCNFRCGFCHNPELVVPERFTTTLNESEIFSYITKYRHLLDAVCITGGEPTIHNDLPDFISKIKKIGLKVKLDSNGTNPNMLQQLIENSLIDTIAMDIKHIPVFPLYNKTTGNQISRKQFTAIMQSVNIIKSSRIEHEFRTTIAKGLHSKKHIEILKQQFPINYKLQNFKYANILNPESGFQPFAEDEFKAIQLDSVKITD